MDNDSDDSLPEVLDEEEQENLIRRLNQENLAQNKRYTTLLLALPILTAIIYLPTLVHRRTSLFSLLSVTSLLSTTYLLYVLPPGITGITSVDALNRRKPSSTSTAQHLHQQLQPLRDEGPIVVYLPYLNLALCTVLAITGLVVRAKDVLWIGFGTLPGGVYLVVLIAKVVMGAVDPEAELGGLKYGYKGA